MSTITLARLSQGTHETIGAILIDGNPICWSLELPWKMNEKGVSCILPGMYFYKHYKSPKYQRTCIKLYNTYNRTNVSLHPGNTYKDTKACILPGLSIGSLRYEKAVLNSNTALDTILNQTSQIGKIHIVEKY